MLNPCQEIMLFRMLASGLPEKIQCSNEKTGKYLLNIPKVIAIKNYKFIQFAHPKKYQWLSIDIDSREVLTSTSVILSICKKNNIPQPTIIVKTNRGWHIHWYLDEALWKNNKLYMLWRKAILKVLNRFFGGDNYAAGFIFRNPFKHDILFFENVYTVSDFEHFISLKQIKEKLIQEKPQKIRKLKKYIDFTKVQEGTRNTTLFVYIRTFMFRNYELGLKLFHIEALRVNSLMPVPLSESEVRATVNSAYTFVIEHYNPNYKNKDQVKYNKKLAKYKAQKTYLKALSNLVENLKKDTFSFFGFIKNLYSFRKLSELAGISAKTIKKYLLNLKEDLLRIIKNKSKIIIDFAKFTFSIFIKEFNNLIKENNKVGVLRC